MDTNSNQYMKLIKKSLSRIQSWADSIVLWLLATTLLTAPLLWELFIQLLELFIQLRSETMSAIMRNRRLIIAAATLITESSCSSDLYMLQKGIIFDTMRKKKNEGMKLLPVPIGRRTWRVCKNGRVFHLLVDTTLETLISFYFCWKPWFLKFLVL